MFFEVKRFHNRKYDMFIIAIFVLLIVLSFVNKYIVQGFYETNNLFALDYYNVVCQTEPFLLTPIIGMYFTDDYEKNINIFYSNYGITKIRYYLLKLIAPIFFSVVITFAISMPFLIIMGISLNVTFQTTFLLIMDSIYYILIMAVLSMITKKRVPTIFAGMGLIILISILNFLPLGFVSGHLFLLDGNSYLTNQVTILINEGMISCYKLLFVQLIYIFIVLIIYILIIYFKKNNGK